MKAYARILAVGLSVALAGLLSACGAGPTDQPAASGEPTAPAQITQPADSTPKPAVLVSVKPAATGESQPSDEPEPTDWDGIGATEAVRPEMPSLFVINGGSLGGWDEAAPAPPKAEEPRQEPPRGGQGKSSLEALLRKVTGARAGDKGKKSRTVPDRRPAADSEQTVLDGFMEYTRRQG